MYYSDNGEVSIANNYSEAQTTEEGGQMKSKGEVEQTDGWIGVQYPIWTAGQPSLRLPSRPT